MLPDVLGIAWIVLFVALYLSPALKDGPYFGPADLGTTLSNLTHGALPLETRCIYPVGATACAHNSDNGDIIDQSIPWNTTDWQLVHAGELPLWNDLSGNGLPQFLNFESGAAALPTLVGYLFPLGASFLVSIIVKLLLAGLGTYWCCRLFGARPLAAALGGTTFMLCGSLSGWLGWSVSSVLVFAGLLVASLTWCYRSARRTAPIVVLAISIAFAIYGGFPEDYVLVGFALAVLLVVVGLATLAARRGIDRRGLGRLALGAACGFGLSAPLWLPGLSVLRSSVRGGEIEATGLPLHYAALVFAGGYDGIPISGNAFFANLTDQGLYFETASYLGLCALALALVALIVERRRPIVLGLGAMGLVSLLLSFRLGPLSPVQRLVIDLGLGNIVLSRALSLFGFSVAVLAALGASVLLRATLSRRTAYAFAAAAVTVSVVLFALGVKALFGSLRTPYAGLRRDSLIWPTLTALLLLGVAALVVRRDLSTRLRSILLAALLLAQSLGLLVAGVGVNSYAPALYPQTAALTAFERIVGTSLVAIDNPGVNGQPPDVRTWQGIGVYPEMNVAMGIDELALHDPTAPRAVFTSWPVPGENTEGGGTNIFVPTIDTVALAKRYGVGYVLVFPGLPAPPGMAKVATIAGTALYRVPGSARFTIGGRDAVLAATHPGDATYTVRLATPAPGELVGRITSSPGWTATADGSSLPLQVADGNFLAVAVPAGTTAVTFSYHLPHRDAALALFVLSLVAFAAFAASLRFRRRTVRPERSASSPEMTDPGSSLE